MAINNVLYTRVSNAVAAGTDDQTDSSSVDMANFDDVTFVAAVGTLTATAVTSMHLAGSNDDSTFVDLASTSQSWAADDDNQIIACELIKPIKYRYIRAELVRATANAVIDSIVAHQTRAAIAPVTQGATVASTESHANPATGTA